MLFKRARFHRGLLVVPVSALGGGYSFAIAEPDSWDAIDSDHRSYGSLEECLQAGMNRIEFHFAQLPSHLQGVMDQVDTRPNGLVTG
ncbi:MAG: hypothetical protein AAGF75_05655 [Cyanobacteria bacterium P01_H01_bin.130]